MEVETIKQRDGKTSSVGGFDIADSGIFVIDKSTNPFTVEMFSFVSPQLVPVARLPGARSVANVAVSRDGRSIVYVEYESRQGDIEMLQRLR